MPESIIFRQELINNTIYTFIVGEWPNEIIIANSLLNEPNSKLLQVNTTSIIINVKNGSAEYRLIKTDIVKQYCIYTLIESVLINN